MKTILYTLPFVLLLNCAKPQFIDPGCTSCGLEAQGKRMKKIKQSSKRAAKKMNVKG